MSFHEKPMKQRWQSMDDEAIGVFTAVWPNNWIRYGLDRAPIGTRKWSDIAVMKPDCADKDGLIEVQGFGGDRMLKVKDKKRAALQVWDQLIGYGGATATLRFFVWDRTLSQWTCVPWSTVDAALDDPWLADAYHDGPTYRALHADQIADWPWTKHDTS